MNCQKILPESPVEIPRCNTDLSAKSIAKTQIMMFGAFCHPFAGEGYWTRCRGKKEPFEVSSKHENCR